MQLREKVIGVLYHDSRLTNSSFRKSDLKLLSYFAAQAAVLLENISSYEKIQELNKKLNTEKEYLEDEYKMRMHWGNIIGDGPAVKGVMTRIEKVAKTDSNVLILGETGVGKELVANAIHKNSLRSNKPFIVIQCSALTESLVQSELFGHEKGSFTGATKRKLGRIELAHGGTLFMDEIGDISMEVQVRMLRVIQTKRFERIGGNDTLQSDFRLITATNRNLEAAVRDGTFRLDLYYRLNVFPVYVPPLRERKDDIPSLVQYFLSLHSKRIGKYFKGIHEDALNLLMNYDWPGNIRELENTIERGMILNQPPILKTIDLPSTRIGPGPSNTDSFSPSKSFATLDENERCHILRALKQSNWRVGGSGGAADILKINPSTLRFRIKKMGIKQ
jgi:transcriptional regulator with GAF, ATPase, and Fis domain